MSIKRRYRQALIVIISLFYILSALPLPIAAINLNHGHLHSVKFSFDDGHLDLIFVHEDRSSDSTHDHESNHKVHIQEELAHSLSLQTYADPELLYSSKLLVELLSVTSSVNKNSPSNRNLLTIQRIDWPKLNMVILI